MGSPGSIPPNRIRQAFQAARPFASSGAGQAFSAARCGRRASSIGYQIGRITRSSPMIPPVSTKCVMRAGAIHRARPVLRKSRRRAGSRSLISGRRAEHRFGKPDRAHLPLPLAVDGLTGGSECITPARKFRMLLHINPTRQRGKRTGSLARASGWYMTFFAAGVIKLRRTRMCTRCSRRKSLFFGQKG